VKIAEPARGQPLGSSPSLALNARGDAIVAWTRGIAVRTRLEARTASRGGRFRSPVALAGGEVEQPRIAMNDRGAAVVLWSRTVWVRGAPFGVTVSEARYRRAGGSFGARQTIARDRFTRGYTDVSYERAGAVALDEYGRASVLVTRDYPVGDRRRQQVMLATTTSGGRFRKAATIPVPENADHLSLAVNARGDTAVAWQLFKVCPDSDYWPELFYDTVSAGTQVALRPAGQRSFSVSPVLSDSELPTVRLAGDGTATLATVNRRFVCTQEQIISDGPDTMQVRQSGRTGALGSPTDLGGFDFSRAGPNGYALAANARGDVLVGWQGGGSLKLARRRPGGHFVVRSVLARATDLDIALNRLGVAAIGIRTETRSGGDRVTVRTLIATPQRIGPITRQPGLAGLGGIAVGIDARGRALATWGLRQRGVVLSRYRP
jgi:hypothetical protein